MLTDAPVIMILAITYLPVLFLLECRLYTYFGGGPWVNLSVLVVGCACIGGSAFFGMKAQKLKTASQVMSLYIKVLVAIVMAAVILHPFDYDDLPPLAVVYKTVKAYASYSQVTYPMLYSENARNDALKVTALYKFRNELPKRTIVVHYYESEKTQNVNSRLLIFENRNSQWKQFIICADDLKGNISVRKVQGAEPAEIYTFTINGHTFSEKYATGGLEIPPHFELDESKWIDGQPRITVRDWEQMSFKQFYRSYYKWLVRYKS